MVLNTQDVEKSFKEFEECMRQPTKIYVGSKVFKYLKDKGIIDKKGNLIKKINF
jgi:hypothetical protein